MVSYANIIGLCHSVAILWGISCDVAALPFQAQANYLSIDYDPKYDINFGTLSNRFIGIISIALPTLQ